ncbi:hypothetical protein RhiirA1_453514 [Rhizophagus irregularis]|uniref:Uncharacterized protein n=2 Tax=Rhizophagus irregularis TaxID=588596 RepID=A0A2N0S7A3_9GLOM|nr:hypothetical protein GLOIN_2v1766838 [Rhizophagus irregularis DAOM 181602=DAOM 197198]PKC71446.1 hypothetical protein RhiirA1_453514 [Rhizophagus irregularis]POG78364.1 hypothetical protein GLOIN_2v1766838 [Rhizophagus irregularis DAOM 181602=DAOM 197198]|eukprot:XP_025185230.1 hypothetical protein GLOIN_2v1766838 [Rhizophagus irregularis DAOM 181602=DAOM 197198]
MTMIHYYDIAKKAIYRKHLLYFGSPSENRKPDFLKIPERPKGLEFDIYYSEYSFVIEMQGEQHEKFNKFFHRGNSNNFIKQQVQD